MITDDMDSTGNVTGATNPSPAGVRRFTRRHMIALATGSAGLVGATWAGMTPAHADPPPASRTPWTRGPVVNVLDHGARGDGVTDDVAAFRAAMQAVGAAGSGTLLIPPRTYLINDAIFLVDNVHILGTGATLTKTSGPHSWFVSLSGSNTGYGSGVRNVKAEGITFLGSFDTPYQGQPGVPIQAACGFALHHAQDVLVERCHFVQTQGVGHHLDLCGCERITVRDCVFTGFRNFKTSGYNKTECIELDQSRRGALTYVDDPAGYDGLFTRDVSVENCSFMPVEVDGQTYPCGNPLGAHGSREGHRYENISFTRNLVVDPMPDPSTPELDHKNVSASWKGVTHFPTTRNLTIADNTFLQHQPGSVRAISVFSIDVSDLESVPPSQYPVQGSIAPIASENVLIKGNRFVGFRPPAEQDPQEVIWIRGVTGAPVRNVTIVDNTFDEGRADSGRGTFAVRLLQAENVAILRNTYSASAGGVLLSDTNKFAVIANDVAAGPGTRLPAAISIEHGSRRGTAVNNATTGFANPVTVDDTCRNVIVRHNA